MNQICENSKNKEYIDFILSIELENTKLTKKLYKKDKHTVKWAAKWGYLSVVKYLLLIDDSESNNTVAPTAMDLACEYGHLHLVKWFHKKSFFNTDYAMNHAAKNGHYNVVKWLDKHAKNNDIKYRIRSGQNLIL